MQRQCFSSFGSRRLHHAGHWKCNVSDSLLLAAGGWNAASALRPEAAASFDCLQRNIQALDAMRERTHAQVVHA